jgi:HD-GYP domain-containing protein (c-di-GMP phosphodiesterase class II)
MEVDMAIEVMKKGAFDYLVKPVNKDKMIVTVEKAVNHKRVIEENLRLREENRSYQEMLERKIEESAIELERYYNQSDKTIMDLVRGLSEALENKDPYKRGHINRVSCYARGIAKVFNFSKIDLKALEYSALLHDCGMIGIRGAILDRKGKLSEEEYTHIKKHPLIGEDIIKKVDFLKLTREPIRNHHERYDGQGYPDGLKKDYIPFSARIIAVADSFDALTNVRPYRGAMSNQQALSILKDNRGSQFDPEIVDVFIKNSIWQ